MVTNTGVAEEQKHTTPATAAGLPFIVGLFFAFRLFIMLLSVRLLRTDNQTGVEISLILNFLLLLLVAFQSLGVARRDNVCMLRLPEIRWAVVFLIFSGCSLLWSVTASLPAAIVFWCAMAADVGMVGLLLRVGPVKEVAASLMKGYVWGACAVAIIAWLLPAQSDLRLGDEELIGANQIGYLCAFAAFFAQYLMREKQGKWGAAAVLLAVTLLRSLSKTSIVAFLAAESFLLIRDKSISHKTKVVLVLGSTAVGIAFSGLLTSYFDIYTASGNSPETLTGRIGIWAVFLSEATQQPWIGHGFHSAWKVIPPFGEFEARHAHNELIQQFYAYGVAGVCMLIGLYGSLYRHIRTLPVGPFRTYLSAFLLFILVRGLTDTEPFDLSLPLWAIVMFSLLIEHNRATSGHTAIAFVNQPFALTSDASNSLMTPTGS
jgi:exopolysaccharide production protein ExoQ